MTMSKGCGSLMAAVMALGAASLLSGCGAGSNTALAPVPVQIAAGSVTGTVMGGQQPVAGVALQLYAAGSTGYGSAAMTLLTPNAVKTTVAGNFALPAFTCPSSSALIYLVGTGGTPIGGSANPNLALMAGLGACGALQTSLASGSYFIAVNEVTTVGTVYALSPFMTGIANIGAPVSNLGGITNAFAAINKVVNTQTGQASGPALPTGATLPITEINALGNILENCINSAGGTASNTTTTCGKLFSYATPSGGSAPTDTITAMMDIAQNPSNNVANLNNQQSASPAFSPTLSVNAPPAAWTLAISYTNGVGGASGVATDAAGDVYISNQGSSTVVEFANSGAVLATYAASGSVYYPRSIAVDQNGTPWIVDGNNSIAKLVSPSNVQVISGGGMTVPQRLAFDSVDNVWVTNGGSGGGVSAFTNTGTVLTGAPFIGGGVNAPVSIAITGK